MNKEKLISDDEEFMKLLTIVFYGPEKLASYLDSKKEVENNDEYLLFYIQRFADKQECSLDEAKKWLKELEKINLASAFSIILKEIAVYLDLQYEDHIKNCKEVYSISLIDGRIYKLYAPQIKNYKNFAAFRTIDDAKKACKIMKPYLKRMFGKSAK